MIYNTVAGSNLLTIIIVNSIFNCGVTIFALISGYFGVSSSAKKVTRIEIMAIMYAVLSVLIAYALSGTVDVKSVIKAFMPISSGRYWYMRVFPKFCVKSRQL